MLVSPRHRPARARVRPLPTRGAGTCGAPKEPLRVAHTRTGRYVSGGVYAPAKSFPRCRPRLAAASEDGRRAFATSHDGAPTASGRIAAPLAASRPGRDESRPRGDEASVSAYRPTAAVLDSAQLARWPATGPWLPQSCIMQPARRHAPRGDERAARSRRGVGSTRTLEHAGACDGHARARRHAAQPCLRCVARGVFIAYYVLYSTCSPCLMCASTDYTLWRLPTRVQTPASSMLYPSGVAIGQDGSLHTRALLTKSPPVLLQYKIHPLPAQPRCTGTFRQNTSYGVNFFI